MGQRQDGNLPNLAGYVIIVTGGNSGIGFETTFQLALHGARVYIAARSKSRVINAIAQIKAATKQELDLEALDLDLGSLRSVNESAKTFMKQESRLDILINNAGSKVMACPFNLTEDGFETQWQTNHLAPFLFVRSLLPVLESTAAASSSKSRVRIINVSSSAALEMAPKDGLHLDDPNFENEQGSMALLKRYGHSKLASVIHARALHKRLHEKGISAYSLHPGIILTNLQSKNPTFLGTVVKYAVTFRVMPGTISVKDGARTTLYCATSGEARSGEYHVPPGKVDRKADKLWEDEESFDRLWVESERMLGEAGF